MCSTPGIKLTRIDDTKSRYFLQLHQIEFEGFSIFCFILFLKVHNIKFIILLLVGREELLASVPFVVFTIVLLLRLKRRIWHKIQELKREKRKQVPINGQ